MDSIEIQYRDGTDETLTGDDLSAHWERVCDTAGIQYAAWRKPKRNGKGTRLAGYLGTPRDEAAALRAERTAALREANRTADMRLAETRDWTYNGARDSYGHRPRG